MPYISQTRREDLEHVVDWSRGLSDAPKTPGELSFLITKLIIKYTQEQPAITYACLNDVLGALEGAKLEFVRRVVNPFEDVAILRNGDLYP